MEALEFNFSVDRVADIYDKTRSLPSEVMERLIGTLSIELKGCGRILDVGVGTGRIAEPLQKAGFEVVGIDISEKMIYKAKEKGLKRLLLADARFLPFKPKVFGASICVHVLHLISGWQKVLQETVRVSWFAMFSSHGSLDNPVREGYDTLLRQHGYERHRPGISEQEMDDLCRIAKSYFVSSYDVNADDSLNDLEQRASAREWEIPRDSNARIAEELRAKFAGKTFKQELYLMAWDINSLETYVNNLHHR